MASLRKKGKVWYYRYSDADGVQRERKGCSDKRETEGMAAAAEAEAAKVRGGYIDAKAPAYLTHEGRPLVEHLDDFRSMLTAKGGSWNHARTSRSRAAKVLDLAKTRRISDQSLSRITGALVPSQVVFVGLIRETVS
jgi:hypothetical protein